MESAILENEEQGHTYLKNIFKAIDNEQINYNWLITDCVCYPDNSEYNELFSREYIWVTGKQFTEIINEEDIQFIWGVFSGFSKEISIQEILKYNLPYADGYGGFWEDEVGIQHALANIEIVAWDSSYTLFISNEGRLVEKFREFSPLAEDLSAQNTRDNSEIYYIEKLLRKELLKRKIKIDEKILYKKYFIWNSLYADRNLKVRDEDIINSINKTLDAIIDSKL